MNVVINLKIDVRTYISAKKTGPGLMDASIWAIFNSKTVTSLRLHQA